MHMARLEDSSKLPGSYSLASLTAEHAKIMVKLKEKYLERIEKQIVMEIMQTGED